MSAWGDTLTEQLAHDILMDQQHRPVPSLTPPTPAEHHRGRVGQGYFRPPASLWGSGRKGHYVDSHAVSARSRRTQSGGERDAEVSSRTSAGAREDADEAGAERRAEGRPSRSRDRRHEPRAQAEAGWRDGPRSAVRRSPWTRKLQVASAAGNDESQAEESRAQDKLAAGRLSAYSLSPWWPAEASTRCTV